MTRYLHPAHLNDFARQSENFSILANMSVGFENSFSKIDENWIGNLAKGHGYFSTACNRMKTIQLTTAACLKARDYHLVFFSMETAWKFIPGLGSAHIHETGISLNHIYGLPYLSGSGCKGIARQYVLEYLFTVSGAPDLNCLANLFESDEDVMGFVGENDIGRLKRVARHQINNTAYHDLSDEQIGEILENENLIQLLWSAREIFGTQQSRGKVIFFDAFPEALRTSVCIMNPHHSRYYSSATRWPDDVEAPIPIKFLSIENASFIFGLASKDHNLVTEARVWLEKALEELGAGAKTAVGYGYFSKNEDLEHRIESKEHEITEWLQREKARQGMSPEEKMARDITEKPFEKARKMIEEFLLSPDKTIGVAEMALIEDAIVQRVYEEVRSKYDADVHSFIVETVLQRLSEEKAKELAIELISLKKFSSDANLREFIPSDPEEGGRTKELIGKIASGNANQIKEGLSQAGKFFDDPAVSDESKRAVAEAILGVRSQKAIKRKILEKAKMRARAILGGGN